MNRNDMDGDLRERFARLREYERARAGSFLRVRARSSRERHWTLSLRVVLSAAAVVALAFVTATSLSDRGGSSSLPGSSGNTLAALPVGSWDAPTDFLLETPGTQLLNSMPSIGRTRGWGMPGVDPEGARPIGTDSQGRAPS